MYSEINVKQKYLETRRLFSETKAIMSPQQVIGWKHLLLIGRWYYKLELLQEVMKFQKLFPNSSNGSRDTRHVVTISFTLNYHLELDVTLVKHALCASILIIIIRMYYLSELLKEYIDNENVKWAIAFRNCDRTRIT